VGLRRSHLPQALPRQPLSGRRAHDRTDALGRSDLPASAARSTPTSPTPSPPKRAAIRFRR